MLFYFTRDAIKYQKQLKKRYIVDSVSEDHTTFQLKEIPDLEVDFDVTTVNRFENKCD